MTSYPNHYAFLDIQIKNYDLVQLTKSKHESSILLSAILALLHKQLQPKEYMLQPAHAHFQLFLQVSSLPILYQRLYAIDDAIYEHSRRILSQALFLGIGVYITAHEEDTQTAFANAQLARIMSPDAQRLHTHIEFYDTAYRTLQIRKRSLEQVMHKAVTTHEFQLYLQPKIPLKPHLPFAAEALFRWPGCPQQHMSIYDIITLAEANGFIEEIDIEIFTQTCRYQQYRLQHHLSLFPISVNLSRVHFTTPAFFKRYQDIFSSFDLPVSCIEFELTESALQHYPQEIYTILYDIKAQGFAISLDDFGCGASSIQALKEFPFSTIKLDRFLFLNESFRSRTIVKSILSLAEALELQCVAEGIEQDEQVAFLTKEGCDYIQGYIFSPPLSLEQFEQFLSSYEEAPCPTHKM